MILSTTHWVQCEQPLCEKWRRIPSAAFLPPASDGSAGSSLTCLYPLTFEEFSALRFFCWLHPDLSAASCAVKEDSMEEDEKEFTEPIAATSA